jgi:hypothetical protein
MAAEDIRNIVDRCYVGGAGFILANNPNPLDGSNPASLSLGGTSAGPISPPDPAETIQQLVGRCYAGTPPLQPNPLDQANPRIPAEVAPLQVEPTPAEVIQELVGRCYPGLPTLQTPYNIPEVQDNVIEIRLEILDWLCKNGFLGDQCYGPDLVIKLPNPNDARPYIRLGNNDDCAEVMQLRVKGQAEKLSGNRWRNKKTGEILICNDDIREQDLDWERCVRNTLDCFFKPYAGGRWKPPAASCDTHYPNGWSANLDRVCVKNCFPTRLPVYETYSGGKHTYSLTGSGDPAFHILKDPISPDPDNPVTVPLFYYINSAGDGFLTTNPGQPDGPGSGERATMNAAGMQFQAVFGYVFSKAADMISYMSDDEQGEALYRFYNGSDHMYTIDPEFLWDFPQTLKRRNAYRIPKGEINADLLVTTDTEKGSAGYDNALGYYLADKNGPQVGYVIVKSAKAGTNINRVTIPASQLRNYKRGSMGFFLIPDGADLNSLSKGQQINFSPQGDGFRGNGISTAQGNYCLFSDNRWNPNNKDQTKWKGRNKQLWEDLLNGDDDYDDLKFWHKVQWTSNGYYLEGIQCYVFDDQAPPPVYRTLKPPGCDDRSLEKSFKDVTIGRADCGSLNPTVLSEDTDWECRNCTGAYTIRQNDTQTYVAPNAGTYRIVSMGGITGGLVSSCIRFKFRFKKNGSTIYDGDWVAQYWPAIGQDINSSDINLSAGDTLTFEFVELVTGPHTGSISPSLALYNTETGVFDSQFSINLTTVATDDDIGTYTSSPYLNPNTTSAGAITSMAMQFKPYNRAGSEWQPGSVSTEAWYVDDDDLNQHPYTLVWVGGARVSMHGTLQNSPANMGGHRRDKQNRFMPNIDGGYIDTGYIPQSLDQYELGQLPTDVYRALTGCYNQLLENYLVTRFNNLNLSGSGAIREKIPTAYAKGYLPWYELAQGSVSDPTSYLNVLSNNWTNGPGSANFYSPCTFIHDYVLDGESLQGAGNPAAAAKVRIGITFYPAHPAGESFSRTKYYWQAIINVIDVINPGRGYSEGMTFDLLWPPPREKSIENITQSPYYPDYQGSFKKPNRKLIGWYERNDNVKRSVKEAIYQESHNTNSPYWYFCSDRNKDRLKFRIIITEAT